MSSVQSASIGLASLYAAMRPPAPPREPAIDLDAVAADAYRAGLAAGLAEAETRLAPERAVLAGAIAAFDAAMVVDPETLRRPFVVLVTALARAVVAAELRIQPDLVARLVEAALAAVAPHDDTVVRVHPDDAVHLSRTTAVDPSQPRGTVVVEGPTFVVADGLDARLAALLEGLV